MNSFKAQEQTSLQTFVHQWHRTSIIFVLSGSKMLYKNKKVNIFLSNNHLNQILRKQDSQSQKKGHHVRTRTFPLIPLQKTPMENRSTGAIVPCNRLTVQKYRSNPLWQLITHKKKGPSHIYLTRKKRPAQLIAVRSLAMASQIWLH